MQLKEKKHKTLMMKKWKDISCSETDTHNSSAAIVILRNYLLSCRIEENGTGSGEFNHVANISEVTKKLKRSRSWYFKAAKQLGKKDPKFWRATGTDLCFYRAI